jgi:hypothetical protein
MCETRMIKLYHPGAGGRCDEAPCHVFQSWCDVDVSSSYAALDCQENGRSSCRLGEDMATVALRLQWRRMGENVGVTGEH